jgi:cytochrome b
MSQGQSRLWDWPVRLTHIGLIICVISAYVSYELDQMEWHMRNGFVLLTLVLFRVLWGLFGSSSARFSQFLTGPSAVIAYLRGGAARRWPGHSPVGGWAVVVLLLALLVQASTGLFSSDDLFTEGPLVHLVSDDLSEAISGFHTEFFFVGLAALLVLHIGAALFYRFVRKQDLITPMVTGSAPLAPEDAQMLRFAPLWRAALLLALSAAVVWFVVTRI